MAIQLTVKEGDIGGAIVDFMASMLESGSVAAVMLPLRVSSGDMIFPALASDPAKVRSLADPAAPVLPVSTAQMVSRMTRESPVDAPVAILMRNCQIRALTELVKLKQINNANLVIIGIDCPGTVSIRDFRNLSRDRSSSDLLKGLLSRDEEITPKLRNACRACREPVPTNCDLTIGLFGVDVSKECIVEAATNTGKEILDTMNLTDSGLAEERKKAVEEVKERAIAADEAFRKETESIHGIEEILSFYASCINCKNCRTACPICYCTECFFTSDALARTGDEMLKKSRARGAFKLPLDTLLFHTGRMNHMILSCVECGLCEQACPVDIELMRVLKRVAHNAQEKFGYRAGRSLDEEIPLTVFHEKEFTEVGEH